MPSFSYLPKTAFAAAATAGTTPELRLSLLAAMLRLNTLYMIQKAGSGHIGSSFSCLDLLACLHYSELDPAAGDLCFSSKGHDVPALYALLIARGVLPEEKLHGLRRLHGLPGHPDVATPGIVTNTGSLGMGISKAKGMILAHRLNGTGGRVFVITGDGELQEGQFWESLQPAANRQLGELTVIIDHNKIQSDTFVEEVSSLGDLPARLASHGWHVARVNGHDPAALLNLFAQLRAVPDRPKIVIADTIKGRGISFAEKHQRGSFYRYHSGSLPDDASAAAGTELTAAVSALWTQAGLAGAPPFVAGEVPAKSGPPPRAQALVRAYGEELLRLGQEFPQLVALDADLVVDTGLVPFRNAFPERYLECGIAEQDMVSTAGGLALAGKLPAVHSFACFLTPRANEQFYNNASERTRIVYAGSLAGLLPATPGHSHQSLRDIALLGNLPGLTLVQPGTETETRQLLRWAVAENPGSTYLRLCSVPVELPFAEAAEPLLPGRGRVLLEGRDGVVVTYGPVLLAECYRALSALAAAGGPRLTLVNLPWLNRVDLPWLGRLLADAPFFCTVDDHYLHGGQGQFLMSHLPLLGCRATGLQLGLTDLPVCGQAGEALAAHSLDAASLQARLRAACPSAR